MQIKSNYLIKEIIINHFVLSIIYLDKLVLLTFHMMILCLRFQELMDMLEFSPSIKYDLFHNILTFDIVLYSFYLLCTIFKKDIINKKM
jgi:hypothetical protein